MLVHNLGALVLVRLPGEEHRPLPVGEDRHPSRLHDVERLHDHLTARVADLCRGLVGAVNPDVRIQDRNRRGALERGADRGHVPAT